MEALPQSDQGGVSDGHDNRRGDTTTLISTNEEELISEEVVIISDDGSEDPKSTKEGGGSIRRRRRPCVTRRRWTLTEDCKLVEMIAGHKQKFLWKTVATRFPQRTSNSCRLRWLKMFKPDDAFTDNRWSEMAIMVGDRVINQWRLMLAQNTPKFYTSIYANHPLKRSCVQNVAPMITGPSRGGDDNGVGDTSMGLLTTSGQQSLVCPAIDLSLSLGT